MFPGCVGGTASQLSTERFRPLVWEGEGLAGEAERGVSSGRTCQDPMEDDGAGDWGLWLGGWGSWSRGVGERPRVGLPGFLLLEMTPIPVERTAFLFNISCSLSCSSFLFFSDGFGRDGTSSTLLADVARTHPDDRSRLSEELVSLLDALEDVSFPSLFQLPG